MVKNIIFCADGTWNGPGQDDASDANVDTTNVFKLFCNLEGIDSSLDYRLADEQETVLTEEENISQIAKYLHGVGDSKNFLVKALGGGMGAGIVERIVRGYTFISRNYVFGDKIFLNGFSRGAYTARALAGLIVGNGLLDSSKIDLEDKEAAYRAGASVWYRSRLAKPGSSDSWLGQLEKFVTDLPRFVSGPLPDLIKDIPIEAVAVWDTVGSLGIPDYVSASASVDVFRFADTKLAPAIKHAFHAVALDEKRANFTPTWWDVDRRVEQYLFPGAHCDVGGGYPLSNGESGLSDCALDWMREQLSGLGVKFSKAPVCPTHSNPMGLIHESEKAPPFNLMLSGSRAIPGGIAKISDALQKRLNDDKSYAPLNLLSVKPS